MELFTLVNVPDSPYNKFDKQDVIDEYKSLIWVERYYGDGEVEIVLPMKMDLIEKIQPDTFLGIDESNEMMIVETVNIENGQLKVKGISVLSWLNNRFIRRGKSHKKREWTVDGLTPGALLWGMLYDSVDPSSVYMGSEETDILTDYLTRLAIPEIGLHNYDDSGDPIKVTVSYGPLYDALKEIAETFKIGMQMVLERNFNPFAERPLGFRSYRGVNKTYTQDLSEPQNQIVRFSPYLESLENPSELHSKALFRTIAFGFAPNIDADVGLSEHGANNAGIAYPAGFQEESTDTSGFKCKALQVFAEDITGYPEPLSNEDIRQLIALTSEVARQALSEATTIRAVDGEIVSTSKFQYEKDYKLGDLVELEGITGTISIARVTEYIRVQDESGKREYPTVTLVETENDIETVPVDDLAPQPINQNDNVGDAIELEGNIGKYKTTNIDCTTDATDPDSGNTDWLVNEFSQEDPPYSDTRNWKTMWFKWAVPVDDWVEGSSIFSAFLTDYDSHSILFLCTPWNDSIPSAGNPPDSASTYQTLGGDFTPINRKAPYGLLARSVTSNFWVEPSSNEPWIYIGVATPPGGEYGNTEEERGGRFTLHWSFIP